MPQTTPNMHVVLHVRCGPAGKCEDAIHNHNAKVCDWPDKPALKMNGWHSCTLHGRALDALTEN